LVNVRLQSQADFLPEFAQCPLRRPVNRRLRPIQTHDQHPNGIMPERMPAIAHRC
jgi:hypothetical protein